MKALAQRDPAPTRRGHSRREKILAAAAELFRKRGFHGTGIDDIGAAVGITGPGVYRHFEGKHDLLAAIMERGIARHQVIVEEALATTSTPRKALERFVTLSARALVEDQDLTAIYFQEMRNLPADDRARLGRMQRLLIEEWVHVLSQVRPELGDEEARLTVRAVGGLMNSLAYYHSSLDPARLQELLAKMAMAALLAR
jgi:AcrR family transcriptional regulator